MCHSLVRSVLCSADIAAVEELDTKGNAVVIKSRLQKIVTTMQRVAFKMKLFKGCEDEYKKRHDAIGNELKYLLKQAGIKEYSIFLDEETNSLFAYLTIDDAKKLGALPDEPVMKKWWTYMKDLMETNEDNSPVTTQLKEVFYLK